MAGSDDDGFIIDIDKSDKDKGQRRIRRHNKIKATEKDIKDSRKQNRKFIKSINDVESDITRDIKLRKIIPPLTDIRNLRDTAESFGHGFAEFVETEERIVHDFFFGWLPSKLRKYIKLIIPFLALAIMLNLPLNLDIEIKKALGLFLCIALLWALESISIVVTALLIPVLAVILGLIESTSTFRSFSNPIIYLLLSGLIIAQAFKKHHLDRLLANKILALSRGKVDNLLFFTMAITGILGMWMSNTATMAMLIPVIISVTKEITHKIKKDYTSMLLLAAGFSSSVGGLSTIIGGNQNAITAAFLRNTSEFTFYDWSVIGFPIAIILMLALYFIFLRIYSVSHKDKIELDHSHNIARQPALTYNQKKVLLIFFPTLFFWLFAGKLSALWNIPHDYLGTEMIGLWAAIFLFAFHVLEWEDVRKISWEIFLIVGGGLTLGQILITSGSAAFISTKLFSSISFMPDILIILVIIILTMILTNFVNNSSATIILVPVVMNLSSSVGISMRLLAMAVAMSTTLASLTPIAMPSFSMIYGTGKVKRDEMIKTGLTIALVCAPILSALIYLADIVF